MCDEDTGIDLSINILLDEKSWQTESYELICENLRVLRNSCCHGPDKQLKIVENDKLLNLLEQLLFPLDERNGSTEGKLPEQVRLVAGQLMANTIVNNGKSRSIIWQRFGQKIINYCLSAAEPQNLSKDVELDCNLNIFLMILYSVHIVKLPLPQFADEEGAVLVKQDNSLTASMILRAVIAVWRTVLAKQSHFVIDYLHFLFEVFLVKDGELTVNCYKNLVNSVERLTFLDYVHCYLDQNSPNGPLHYTLLEFLAFEFKMKSDCILRLKLLNEIELSHPQEIYSILKILAATTGSDRYSTHFATDHSLFLNISSLLRCLVELGKNNENGVYQPLNKLEEVAPCSNIPRDFEDVITFELKTLLVRCTANLLHNNSTNKKYCIETQLMPTLLECTNMDARNPMIREWSILAIRNACHGCKEIQDIVANIKPEPNRPGFDLNKEMGALHIKP